MSCEVSPFSWNQWNMLLWEGLFWVLLKLLLCTEPKPYSQSSFITVNDRCGSRIMVNDRCGSRNLWDQIEVIWLVNWDLDLFSVWHTKNLPWNTHSLSTVLVWMHTLDQHVKVVKVFELCVGCHLSLLSVINFTFQTFKIGLLIRLKDDCCSNSK